VIDLLVLNRIFFIFQLLVSAYDSALPDDKAFATMIINIDRNLNSPVFENGAREYIANIRDFDPKGTFVLDINATDSDATVSIFVATGYIQGKMGNHVFFNPLQLIVSTQYMKIGLL